MQNMVEYGESHGGQFYSVIKGVLLAKKPNSDGIKDWEIEYSKYQQLKKWHTEFIAQCKKKILESDNPIPLKDLGDKFDPRHHMDVSKEQEEKLNLLE